MKAICLMRKSLIPWQIILGASGFRRTILFSVLAWAAASAAGLTSNIFLFGWAVSIQLVVSFIVIGDALTTAILKDPATFDWAIQEKMVAIISNEDLDLVPSQTPSYAEQTHGATLPVR
jgi:hypothetical protein